MGVLLFFLLRIRLLPWHRPLLYKWHRRLAILSVLNSSELTVPELHHFPLTAVALTVFRLDEWGLMQDMIFHSFPDPNGCGSPW